MPEQSYQHTKIPIQNYQNLFTGENNILEVKNLIWDNEEGEISSEEDENEAHNHKPMIYTIAQLKNIIKMTLNEGEFSKNIKGLLKDQKIFKQNFINLWEDSESIKENSYHTYEAIHNDMENIALTLLDTQVYLSTTKSKLHRDIRVNTTMVRIFY